MRIGNITLRNRIIQTPHQILMEENGVPGDRSKAYYVERARGGAALIVAGGFTIDPRRERSDESLTTLTDPRMVEAFSRIASAVHSEGCALSVQLHWNGRAGPFDHARLPALAPSPLPDVFLREIPKEIETNEIAELVRLYGVAAGNALAAGLDGVEILAAQGYGINQFLSPVANRRADAYGGVLQNRMRFLLDVVNEVRSVVGTEFMVGVRLNADDGEEGGLRLAESCQVAAALETSGKVDYLSISAGSAEHRLYVADMGYRQGILVPMVAELRSATRLPLVAVVRIKRPEHAEAILAQGHADLIGMNRALIADPELPAKIRTGRVAEIRPCIGCNQGCLQRAADGWNLSCTVNPVVGNELKMGAATVSTVARSRTVLIVGGGPGGLETARLAALRGHRVTLWEQEETLGGQLKLAATARSREELGEAVVWLEKEVRRLGVTVRTGLRASAADVIKEAPDAVVVATGSLPLRTGHSSVAPEVDAIPGHDLPNVLTSWEALLDEARLGKRIIIVEDDPHLQALTVAVHLIDGGRSVTLVTRHPQVGMSSGSANLPFWYRRLFRGDVRFVPNAWVRRIRPDGVEAYNIYSHTPEELPKFDTVILATGNRVEDSLYRDLMQRVTPFDTHRVGDCLAPRRLDAAMWEAAVIGRAL